jgi:hypothetical protein
MRRCLEIPPGAARREVQLPIRRRRALPLPLLLTLLLHLLVEDPLLELELLHLLHLLVLVHVLHLLLLLGPQGRS